MSGHDKLRTNMSAKRNWGLKASAPDQPTPQAAPSHATIGFSTDLPYPPGAILATDRGFFTHYGIAGDSRVAGEQSVISCSRRRRGCAEESLSAFANGTRVTCHGLIGNLAPFDILARARADIGSTWHLMTDNCEHHVTRACGLKPKSPQIRRAAAGTMAIAVLALVPGLRLALLKAAATGV